MKTFPIHTGAQGIDRWISYGLMNHIFSWIKQVAKWEYGGKSMKVWIPCARVQTFKLVRAYFWPFNSCGTSEQHNDVDQVHPITLMATSNKKMCCVPQLVLCRSVSGTWGRLPSLDDLLSIEHYWDNVERATPQMDPQPSNLKQLDTAINQALCKVLCITLQCNVESMPTRITALLKAKKCVTIKYR